MVFLVALCSDSGDFLILLTIVTTTLEIDKLQYQSIDSWNPYLGVFYTLAWKGTYSTHLSSFTSWKFKYEFSDW